MMVEENDEILVSGSSHSTMNGSSSINRDQLDKNPDQLNNNHRENLAGKSGGSISSTSSLSISLTNGNPGSTKFSLLNGRRNLSLNGNGSGTINIDDHQLEESLGSSVKTMSMRPGNHHSASNLAPPIGPNPMSKPRVDPGTPGFYSSLDLPQPRRHSSSIMTQDDEDDDGLGPLPYKWEKAYTESGEVYFIDHNTGTSHWLDPRLSKFQKKSLEDCMDDELPYGWEKIHDPQYGTYFIDHVNRRTQYENPVLEAKRRLERSRSASVAGNVSGVSNSSNNEPGSSKQNNFTRNPSELCGERITTTLLKSSRGLGFTIVGGDDSVDEFLQIKSIVPNGPAWLDGNLQMGDVLVYVNDICVLGFNHHEMVNVFQSILPGETVTLEVCRGYPLPFDPNDPNTEVVTTIAVDGISKDPEKTRMLMDLNMDGNYNFLDMSDPISPNGMKYKYPNGMGGVYFDDNLKPLSLEKPEILNICIVKGAMGFGFTIADSAHGQRVKKILDRNCCKNLQEGDILLAINSISVKLMSHNEVVQVLKDCVVGQEATLKIQRGSFNSNFSHSKGLNLNSISKFNSGGKKRDGKELGLSLFRSKTPTADLYSTQTKEILPTRPKTPLVDTRARVKTPSNELNNVDAINNNNNSNSIPTNGDHEGPLKDDELDSVLKELEVLESKNGDAKSTNSFPDHDSINNDLMPYSMDPYPKMVTQLTDRLAEASLGQHQNHHNPPYLPNPNKLYQSDLNYDPIGQSMLNDPGLGYNNSTSVYANTMAPGGGYNPPPMPNGGNNNIYSTASGITPSLSIPIMPPIPTYHQDSCFCFECQDYHRQQQEYNLHMQNQYQLQSLMASNRINPNGSRKEYLVDRRMNPHQNQLWKYGPPQSSPNGTMLNHQLAEEFNLSEVTLERQALGFGFRIVGGTEEGSQVTVGHIVPGGAADQDPRIATGDEILSIDGVNVVNASHHRVVQLMGEAGARGHVTMILRRRVMHVPVNQPLKKPPNLRFPYDVIVSRNENEGFGFVIISATNQFYGSTIGKLITGSPADRCNELKVGDRIIAVNRMDIAGMSHGDVVNLIKESGLHVRLTIGQPQQQPPQQTTQQKNEMYNYHHPQL